MPTVPGLLSRLPTLLEEHYGLRGGLTPLAGEHEGTFLLEPEGADSLIVKLESCAEADPEALYARLKWESDLLLGLEEAHTGGSERDLERAAAGGPVFDLPRVVPAQDGRPFVAIGDDEHYLRALTFVPGRPLASIRRRPAILLEGIGRALGSLDLALARVHERARALAAPGASGAERHADAGPAASAPHTPDPLWSIERAPEVIHDRLGVIDDPARRAILEKTLEIWEECVAPHTDGLRRSLVHQDANDHNLLIAGDENAWDHASPRIGLIDFGDARETWTVAEPAIAAAYLMLDARDPLAAAAHLVGGYHGSNPLEEKEIGTIFPLALARLAQSVAISASRREEAAKNPYLRVSEAPAWRTLERLVGHGAPGTYATRPRYATAILRNVCGFEPVPGADRIRAWIDEHAEDFDGVVLPDPRVADTHLLDLSVGSADADPGEGVGPRSAAARARRWSRRIFAAIEDAGAAVGIGRYDEPRLVYTSPGFAGSKVEPGGIDPRESRTIHIGVDLFLPAGSPVFAPIDGRVHSVAINDEPLDYGPTLILEHEPEEGIRFWTLYGHLSEMSIDRIEPGRLVSAGEEIARLGSEEGNGGWPPHLHFQVITDLLGYEGDFPGVALPSRRAVWRSLSPDPSPFVGQDVRAASVPSSGELLQRRRSLLGPELSVSYREPLTIVRGRGAFLFDPEGRAYLDCVNNVAHVGHEHPRVVRAATRQIAVLNTNTRYLHPLVLDYAERLRALFPEELSVFHFVCSGSEANELALRMARAWARSREDDGQAGREPGFMVLDAAYHGNSQALVEVSPYKFDGPGGRGRPAHVQVAPLPDEFRGRYRRDDPERARRYAEGVEAALERLRADGYAPAAFLHESLLSCAGQIECPEGYLARAYDHARAAGALCIADEVQVGFGRVGTHFWGFETQGVVPDIVTLGKPIGNGHPLGAVVASREVAEAFDTGMEYFNTFGGNPVSCAIGLAVLDVIQEEGLQERARVVGARLESGLRGLMEEHPLIGDVRGRGLFLGVELVRNGETLEPAAREAAEIVERMRERGILLSTDGPDHNVIKIKPPLVFSEGDADRVVTEMRKVLRGL